MIARMGLDIAGENEMVSTAAPPTKETIPVSGGLGTTAVV